MSDRPYFRSKFRSGEKKEEPPKKARICAECDEPIKPHMCPHTTTTLEGEVLPVCCNCWDDIVGN